MSMTRAAQRIWIVPCLLCVLFLSTAARAAELRGRVVGVSDGDTLTVLGADKQQHRIRLNGIDAPETGQAFSQLSKDSLSSLVFGRDVLVVWVKADRNGRLLGTVTLGAVNANFEQLKAGLAWYYRDFSGDVSPENRPLYEAAESEARRANRGLWRDPNPIAPWVYRGDAAAAPSAQTAAPRPSTAAPLGLLGSTTPSAVEIRGNRSSMIYHVPGCRNYDDIAMRNRVIFKTEGEAVAAGYRKARNCR